VYWTDEAKASDPDPWGLFVRVTRKQLLPLRERIAFFKDGDEILPGITAIAAHGHSVGHSVLMISSGDESILYAADIAHHLVLLYNPAMTFAHDTDQQQAARSRAKILDMVATDRIRTMSYHFPFPGIGFVSRRGDGFMYHPEPIRTVL
jgi:glyoxylase-like metal-dependent hydrolase (beta-lactamase superfamily II)